MVPRVLNKRWTRTSEFENAVYVGRPSKWGNPYEIGKDGTREEVIELFREYLLYGGMGLKEALPELRGKNLICWCAPLPCHADVLLLEANK